MQTKDYASLKDTTRRLSQQVLDLQQHIHDQEGTVRVTCVTASLFIAPLTFSVTRSNNATTKWIAHSYILILLGVMCLLSQLLFSEYRMLG